MKEYTEDDMIIFALNFGIKIIEARSTGKEMPSASIELEKWKTKTGRK